MPISEHWIPADGDAYVCVENFVFSVFGYEHPESRIVSFLKYIPLEYREQFPLKFLRRTWKFRGVELLRARKLYTAGNYKILLASFREHFPSYVHFCPNKGKEIISIPRVSVKEVFSPRDCLSFILKLKAKDNLQKGASDLVGVLSDASGIPPEDFGLHGSLAMDMHTAESDIDLVVYGAENFRNLERTVSKLVQEGELNYLIKNRLDAARLNRAYYLNTVFMYNAVRKADEIRSNYGTNRYYPLHSIKFRCKVSCDDETMFRPAVYKIEEFRQISPSSALSEKETPQCVVSMIGCYRNIARKGSEIEVSGMLERVDNASTDTVTHQVVVGTAANEEEYIWPL